MSMSKITYRLKIVLAIILILISFTDFLFASENSFQWQVGEELIYKVKWSFIRLGTLRLHVCDTLTFNNTPVYRVKLFIDSNPLLFFVNMHNVYESYIDKDFRLHFFIADEKIDGITYKTEYRFDYVDSLIYINLTDIKDPTRTIIRVDPLTEQIYDGMTLVYYARSNCVYIKKDTLSSFFESKRGKVEINFKGQDDKIKIDALPFPLDSYYVDGFVHVKGIAGLQGPFKGWFATDTRRPPLKANLKVFIGHVKVELESWKNWDPAILNPHR